MRIQRVALLFDDQARPETTGVYCRRALGSLCRTRHFRPREFESIPRRDFDLYLRIDDGLDYSLPADLHPCAWWAIDTHLDFDRALAAARAFDFVFAAQRDGAESLRRAGIASASWLPLACDPEVHRRHEVGKQWDVCFIGNVHAGPRRELLDLLCGRFPNHFVGRCYFEDMARAYSASRLVFNRSIRNDVNMRVFEAVACGSLLLTNALDDNGQAELFRDGEHLATYAGPEELLDKVAFYLGHEEVRERVAAAGRARALAEHTYRHRLTQLLGEVERAPSPPVPVAPTGLLPQAAKADAPSVVEREPADFADTRGQTYFECPRPELLALIPSSAHRVLDVGCGAGRLGAALKARQDAVVVGIEMNPAAAQAARGRLDEVLVGDVEQLAVSFAPGSFDAVVCGDVLEHLREPARLLRRIRTWLQPGGVLVASIPNVRHHSVVRGLLRGDWTYEPAGLLDRDHLRFFTRREIEKLLHRTGFVVQSLGVVPGPGDPERQARAAPDEVVVGGLQVRGLAPAEAREFYAYQYLVCAAPAPAADHSLTSIVILTHNQLGYTRLCVDSIREHTDEPYELIFVDNASTDGTLDYLRSLPGARVIANAHNRGFPAAANQGIRAASGRQVLLLNNDTVVTTGWLSRLVRALRHAPEVGLAGPCSNCVSGTQQAPAPYDEVAALDGFAWDWGKAHDGAVADTDRLVGFCLLIRREVIDRVGLLDERFGVGCFEDDDYCRRAVQAGYRAVVARDAFVHHFGGRTFVGDGVDYEALLRTNRALFQQKWAGERRPTPGTGAMPRLPADVARPAGPRVLLVAHVGTLRDRMDKSHYYRYEALARRPGVTLFGPGVPGYRPGMPLREAIDVACGGVRPDVILHGGDLRASGVPLVSGLEDTRILTAIELLDSWVAEDRQAEFIRRHRFAVGLIQEPGPHQAFYQRHCPGTEFFWTPNAVNTALFRDHGLPKDCDVLLYGEVAPEVYPLRARLARLLTRQEGIRFRHIPHPGYYPPPDAPAESVISGAELSRAINRAWIGIATASVYRCLLMKYLEIPASHALVAGDMPEQGRELFGSDFIEVSMAQSDEEILASLRTHLDDKERLRAMTEAVHRRVLGDYSTEAFADRVLTLFREVLARRQAARPGAVGPATAREKTQRVAAEGATAGLTAHPVPGGTPSAFPVAEGPRSSPPGEDGILLSFCMIARDNARTLRPCLESIRPWVDEMVVVDTGSRDDTPRIAEELGARVFYFPWCDDFSAARNESLRHARGRWIFWMDSDDTIDPACGRQLRALAARPADNSVLGYVVQVHCPGPGDDGDLDVTVVDHVKLFRNLPSLRFEGRIHEQILPAIRRAGGVTAWTDLFVTHSGYDHSPQGQLHKRERDLRLLQLEHRERGEHPFTLFNLGMTYADVGCHEEAVDYLRRSIAHSTPGESHLRKAYALLVYALRQLGRREEAWETCCAGLGLYPGDEELGFRRAVLLHERGELREAAQTYLALLGDRTERHFTSVDRGITGFKARQNLAVVYGDMGEWDQAAGQWGLIVAEKPRYRPGWRGLGEALLRQHNHTGAREVAERLLAERPLRVEGLLLQGQVAVACGAWNEARAVLRQAVAEFPEDVEAWQVLCRFLFEHGEPPEAAAALERLVQLAPEDAAARHNLGTVHLRLGRHDEAVAAYRESLCLRPDSPATRQQLDNALRQAGRTGEAAGGQTCPPAPPPDGAGEIPWHGGGMGEGI